MADPGGIAGGGAQKTMMNCQFIQRPRLASASGQVTGVGNRPNPRGPTGGAGGRHVLGELCPTPIAGDRGNRAAGLVTRRSAS